MTRTVSISLGHSSLSGKSAIDQARKFKDQLRSLWEKPKSVSLLTVVNVEPPHMGVVAVYDAEDAEAREWVKRAEALAPELWAKMNERRKGGKVR
jgi:hypothetical protein